MTLLFVLDLAFTVFCVVSYFDLLDADQEERQ